MLVMKPVDLCSSKTNLKITHFHKYYVVIVTSSKRIPFVYREQFHQAEKIRYNVKAKYNPNGGIIIITIYFELPSFLLVPP